jgi:hypothetical protein
MFFPDFTTRYKSSIFQYAPKSFGAIIFILFEFLFLSISLLFGKNSGELNNFKLGLSVFLIVGSGLIIQSYFIYKEPVKAFLIKFENSKKSLYLSLIYLLMPLLFLIIHFVFYNEDGLPLFLDNFVNAIFSGIFILLSLLIIKRNKKLDDNKLNQNLSVKKVLTSLSTYEILKVSNDTTIKLIVSADDIDRNPNKKIILNYSNQKNKIVEILLDSTFFKGENKEFEEIKMTSNKESDYYIISFESKNIDISINVILADIKYFWIIEKNSNKNESQLDVFMSEKTKDEIYLLIDKELINEKKLEYASIIFYGKYPFRYVFEFENFRFQDLDKDRQISVSKLIEETIVQNNQYGVLFLKTHLFHQHTLKISSKTQNNYFRSNHVFVIFEENELESSDGFATRFIEYYKKIKNDLNGFNLRTSLSSKEQIIEVLHNTYSNNNVLKNISTLTNEDLKFKLSNFRSIKDVEDFINHQNLAYSKIFEFTLGEVKEHYVEIHQSNLKV